MDYYDFRFILDDYQLDFDQLTANQFIALCANLSAEITAIDFSHCHLAKFTLNTLCAAWSNLPSHISGLVISARLVSVFTAEELAALFTALSPALNRLTIAGGELVTRNRDGLNLAPLQQLLQQLPSRIRLGFATTAIRLSASEKQQLLDLLSHSQHHFHLDDLPLCNQLNHIRRQSMISLLLALKQRDSETQHGFFYHQQDRRHTFANIIDYLPSASSPSF